MMHGTFAAGGAASLLEAAREDMREAVAWRLLGLMLERPRDGWAEELRSLAGEAGEPLAGVAMRVVAEAREGDYLAILGPGGPVSPREAAHRGMKDPAAILADLAGFYRAFSYRPRSEDPPDHIAVQLGFAGYLRLKSAFAMTSSDGDAAAVTREGFDRFTEAHLAPVARSVARRLASGESGYLKHVAEALEARFGAAGDPGDEGDPAMDGCGAPCGQGGMVAGDEMHPEFDGGCGTACPGSGTEKEA